MKARNILKKYGPQVAAAAILGGTSVGAFAQEASYETGASLGWIAAGVAGGLIIMGAMWGLVTMIGAGKKAQRAGT